MTKQFVTAAREADEIEENQRRDLPLRIDDRDVVAHYPGDGQLAIFMATGASFASKPERVAGAINFFVSVFDEEVHSWIVSRLFDRKDAFGIKEVTDILEYMMEEWSGNPTDGPSASTRSPRPTGRKSTPRTPALTS